MIAAIAVSAGKVFGIPIVREHILPRLIRTYGCSTAGLRLFRQNTPHKYIFGPGLTILDAVELFHWHDIGKELADAGLPERSANFDEAFLEAAKKGSGKHLRDKLEALGQRSDHILVDCIRQGAVEEAKDLRSCGFDLNGLYEHEEIYRGRGVTLGTMVREFHGETDQKGTRHLTETGQQLLAALGLEITGPVGT